MQSGGASIRTIRIWIKAFIPSTVEGAQLVPGSGEHAGKTMVANRWLLNRSFLTDQRGFSSDIHAEARMHSEIEIDLVKGRETFHFHHCYDTIEVDAKTGEEKCRAQGDTNHMRFHDFDKSPDQRRYEVRIKAGSKNPCAKVGPLKVSPNVDYVGTITVLIGDDPSMALVTFDGKIEKYPAFEMYATANGGEPQTIFQIDVEPNAGISDLPGGPERPVFFRVPLVSETPASRP
jgi:hypothetical protein